MSALKIHTLRSALMSLIGVNSLLLSSTLLAGVHSETVLFLQPDGQNYLLERSIHSDSDTHQLHLPKHVQPDDLRHVSPAKFTWDDSAADGNTIKFASGGFTVIYPDRFAEASLRREADGTLRYRSWNGEYMPQGRHGYWYAPGQFDQFSYTWVLPDNYEVLSYQSNQEGEWTERSNAISFYAEQVNNLTFEMRFRERPPIASEATAKAAATAEVAEKAIEKQAAAEPEEAPLENPFATLSMDLPQNAVARLRDADGDHVSDANDLCPSTPVGAFTDQTGCSFDTDEDGVPDGVDRCVASAENDEVDALGCKREENIERMAQSLAHEPAAIAPQALD